ncbi:DNA polymerase epsilon catalytic subunit A-like [Paramacrobiotus metropolitanus]|uniref:DNA polymerase epsilon catalytic subunit A-like n=1 Tax=Paramacrobiotus metropolitanus TaxID=2943436 RepID=UPI002445A056|nr:DNA polymerase epsilon catalytic subunit A-like [Paramacrobiotus metropolitanus]
MDERDSDNEDAHDEDVEQEFVDLPEEPSVLKASDFAGDSDDHRLARALKQDELDAKFGFERYREPEVRTGYLLNMHSNEVLNEETKKLTAVVDYFFVDELNERFKVGMPYHPYFFIKTKRDCEVETCTYLQRKFSHLITSVDVVKKEDLELLNHLSGLQQKYIKLSFLNVSDLMKVRKELMPKITRNRNRHNASTNTYGEANLNFLGGLDLDYVQDSRSDPIENIIDIREFDVPFHVRVAIDKQIFCGLWYGVTPQAGPCVPPVMEFRDDIQEPPDVVVCAYDIETTKEPLKFPDPLKDKIMMISYMINGQGFLIVNREIVSDDISSFEYTPKPEFEGIFSIFNEPDESHLLSRFFGHLLKTQPVIFTTYNGDFFDWPFIEARARANGISLYDQLGFARTGEDFLSHSAVHMDCFKWVKRDSYLPVGSQNLKAVCKAKLKYNPVELDPELMVQMAREQPQILANYSVSDAVATYYLYMKYVHPFIFALCTIIPMEQDSVLRKGSGTLCETLLMVEAHKANVIFPSKHNSMLHKLTKDGHVVESETYVGGHVEALEAGIFRADLPLKFRLNPEGVQTLIDSLEKTITHAIVEEEKLDITKVKNFAAVCDQIRDRLVDLRDNPIRQEHPLLYHLDVAAMYPNIILTNRLQPSALVIDDTCAGCQFNQPKNDCRRKMKWTWRGEHMPATRSEFHRIQQQLETEKFPPAAPNRPPRAFHQLSREEKTTYEKKRLTEYCRKTYKRLYITREEPRESVVCQRENSFYVDTVRMFRDKRYEHKDNLKKAKQDVLEAQRAGNSEREKKARAMEVVYDSLQLAHKCILNSFYGYVMRRGARWYSMEMAGIVCHTGGSIIKRARQIVEQIGRPLELDTDGIWCAIPKSFPETFKLEVEGMPKGATINYPGVMLNMMVRDEFSNPQYQELTDPAHLIYSKRTENSIAFEVDGPYLAMILPAAKEEGKKLKKRYAVFNFDGSLAELKGFEVKRRGELQLIKLFQTAVFETFLLGESLQECYAEVAKVADNWLDILHTKGGTLADSELCDLIAENRNMSKRISEYGALKSTSISTARRLAEFLGESVIKDAGLNCRYVIAKKPEGAPVTERAIPLAIWQAARYIRLHYLKKWLKVPVLESDDIRDILDWNYYIERLNGAIQKIVTIPAALQSIPNPVPRVPYPDWLHKRMQEHNDIFKQKRITDMFKPVSKPAAVADIVDIEAINGETSLRLPPAITVSRKRKAAVSPAKTAAAAPQRWQDALGQPPPKGHTSRELTDWLDFHRQKWAWMRRHKETRKKSRTLNYDSGIVVSGASVRAFVQQARKDVIEKNWHVVQIAETGSPGLYNVFALIDNTMHTIRLKVYRLFYINRRFPKPVGDGRIVQKVNKILPRSKRGDHVYEYRVEEEAFQKHQNELLNDLTDPSVEGIYETQIPLMFRMLCSMGSVCRIVPQKRREVARRESDVYFLEDIERVLDENVEYLPNGSLNPVYFFHYKMDRKELFALVYVKQRKELIIAKDIRKENHFPAKLDRMYKTMRQQLVEEHGDECLPPEDQEFINKHVETDIKRIYRMLDKSLTDYIAQRHGSSVVFLHGSHPASFWIENIPALGRFPIVPTYQHEDERVDTEIYMNWQPKASEKMLQRFLELHSVVESSLEKCRFFDIPWGNSPKDFAVFGCDLFYARLLQRHNLIMWGTPKERPDFGGKETDDIRLIAEDEEKVLQISQPRLYPTCTVKMEVEHLAVCSILVGHHIHSSEGIAESINFDRAPQVRLEEQIKTGIHVVDVAPYDESAQVQYAFDILGSMVRNITREAERGNQLANEMALHIFRWIRSSTSLLYDPALHRKMIGIMRKMLIKLVKDINSFGCHVVYATAVMMVVNTDKGNVHEALAQLKFTMDRVRQDQLFHGLSIVPERIWTTLLWLDASNYAGVSVKMPEESDSSRIHDRTFGDYFGDMSYFSQEQGDENNPDIRWVWNLIGFLPTECQKMFRGVVTGYVMQANLQYQEYFKKVAKGEIVPRRYFEDEDHEAEAPVVYLQQLLLGSVHHSILQNIQTVMRTMPTGIRRIGGKEVNLFPALPGSHVNMQNPALELTKAVCKVLSLHVDVKDEVRRMKRDLLKMIGVGEFSPQAEWVDPCLTYTLPEVICSECNSCRDLDLCKDQPITVEDSTFWVCANADCRRPYSREEIQQRLFVALKKMNVAYHLQDLVCSKCRQIFDRHVSKTCACAGQFRNTVTRVLLDKLRILENISRHFEMTALCDTVSWMLSMNTFGQKPQQ